jgi:hypothetical protein
MRQNDKADHTTSSSCMVRQWHRRAAHSFSLATSSHCLPMHWKSASGAAPDRVAGPEVLAVAVVRRVRNLARPPHPLRCPTPPSAPRRPSHRCLRPRPGPLREGRPPPRRPLRGPAAGAAASGRWRRARRDDTRECSWAPIRLIRYRVHTHVKQ